MGNIFLQVLEISIMSCYLIVAVLLIRGCFKKVSSSFRCILWLLVGVRLLIPVTISTPFGLVPQVNLGNKQETELTNQAGAQQNPGDSKYFGEMAGTFEERKAESDVHTGIVVGAGAADTTVTGNIAVPGVGRTPGQEGVNYVPAEKTSSETENVAEGLENVFAFFWLGGTFLMLCYMGFSWLRLHRSLRTAIPETVEIGGRQIKVYRAESIRSPFLLGAIAPRIYLPYGIEGKSLEYVLAHELMHIHRKDNFLKPLSFIVLALHWFNPLVWVAYILLGKDIEQACDEQVLRENDALDRAGYARALLSCSSGQRKFYVCPVAFGESDVKVRVKNVLNYKKPGFWVAVICVVACVVVALCFMTVSEDAPGEDFAAVSGDAAQEAGEGESAPEQGSSDGQTNGSDEGKELVKTPELTEEPTPTAETTPTATAAPTAEPTVEPTTVPTATPDPAATPVPTVVPEDYVPGPIAGYTEEQSKQIRDELSGRFKYKVDDKTSMTIWLDSEEYEYENFLGSVYMHVNSGMKFQSLDMVNHIEALEMDGQKWLAVRLVPHVEKGDVVFLHEEEAMEIMIPVRIRADGMVELGEYYPKQYDTQLENSIYVHDAYEEENFIRVRLNLMQADVTHDGIPDNIETLIYLPPEMDMTQDIDTLVEMQIRVDNVLIQVYDGSTATEDSLGTSIFCSGYSTAHVGNGQLSAVHRDGKDYLLEGTLWQGQGSTSYQFDVLALDGAGHQYIIDHAEFNWDSRNEEDTLERLNQEIVTFREELSPWIEEGRIVVVTDLGLYPRKEYMITTEKRQYEPKEFYDQVLKGVR